VTVRAATADDAARVAEVEVLSRQAAYRGLVPQARLDALTSALQLPVSWATSTRSTCCPAVGAAAWAAP